MRKRPIKLSLRLYEHEHNHLKVCAEAAGYPVEQYLRALIADANRQPISRAELAELRRQLAAIGNNLNQIARAVNTYGALRQEDADTIRAMRDELRQYLERI